MITNFKIFEAITILTYPEIGDYVLLNPDVFDSNNFNRFRIFIESNIGQIVNLHTYDKSYGIKDFSLGIKFENVPKILSAMCENFFDKNNIRYCDISNLLCWSKDKEELEIFIATKKYNL